MENQSPSTSTGVHQIWSLNSKTFDAAVKSMKPEKKLTATIPQDSSWDKWIDSVKSAEEWIDTCFRSESGVWGNISENLWLAGAARFSENATYMEALACFYYRNGKPHKSLEALRPLLKNKPREFVIKIAISAAYSLHQPRLVWEYFLLLNPSQRSKLEPDLLQRAASAAMSLEQFSDAEKLFTYLREKAGSTALPSLEQSLMQDFRNNENIEKYISNMNSETREKKSRDKISVTELIRYSSALMYKGNYASALQLLIQVREERYSMVAGS